MGSLVSVYLFELGLVTASQDGHLFFYEVNADREFTQIRHWQYRSDEIADVMKQDESIGDVIRGMQVLDSEKKKMLALQLSDRKVIMIDMWIEVYC